MVTDLIMSLKAKFNQLLRKDTEQRSFGLALNNRGIVVCSKDFSSSEAAITEYPLTNNQSISQLLKEVVNDNHLSGQCQLVLNQSQYFNIQIEPPKVPEQELEQALKWAIKDLVPLKPEEMLLDYYLAPVVGAGVVKFNVVVSNINEVKSWLSVLDEHDIHVNGITTEEFAASNLLADDEEASLLIFQQPEEEITLIIVKQGQIYFSRRLRGYSKLKDKSQEELGYGVIDSLSLEVQRSIDYFERQLKQAPIKRVKVLLPMEHEQYLIERLNENTLAEVSALTLSKSIPEARDLAVSYGGFLEMAIEEAS